MQSNQMQRLLESILILALVCSGSLFAQTFDNPDATTEDGLENETVEPVSEVELDEALEEYLEEQPESEEQISEGGEFDSFVPSEDISEDFSVPFPVDI